MAEDLSALRKQHEADDEMDFLRNLVDVVWNEATESTAVPSSDWAERLILKARKLPLRHWIGNTKAGLRVDQPPLTLEQALALDVTPWLTRPLCRGKPWGERAPVVLTTLNAFQFTGDSRIALDAVVDPWGKSLCTLCVMNLAWDEEASHGFVQGNGSEGDPQFDSYPPRVWWFERRLDPAFRERFLRYLHDPKCTPERHATYEKREAWSREAKVSSLKIQLEEAQKKLDEAKVPGFSIAGLEGHLNKENVA